MFKIRLLHILEATVGGTRKHLNDILLNLDKTKFQVSFICSTQRDKDYLKDIEEMIKSGVKVEIVQMYREIHPVADFVAFIRIYRLMRRDRYDIVHTHSSKAGFLGRLAAKLAGVPVIIYTPHAYVFQAPHFRLLRFLYKMLERFVGSFTDSIIAISESEKRITVDNKIVNPEKVVVVENALDLNDFEFDIDIEAEKIKLGILPNEKVITMVGDLRVQKGCPYFVKSCAEVVKSVPNSKFLLAGKGKMRKKLEVLVQQLGLDKQFLFIENCQDIRIIYKMCDVFVLSSLWEGLPYSLLEAMACRKPVVATDVDGIHDVVIHNVTGYLVPPRNPKWMSESIAGLLNNPDRAKEMGEKGRLEIEKRYQLNQRMGKIEALYEEMFQKQVKNNA